MSKDYLVRQTCGYCFRMHVLIDLQPIVGKAELRYPLYTGSLRRAKRKTKRISRKVKVLFHHRSGNHRQRAFYVEEHGINVFWIMKEAVEEDREEKP